jgi:SAM-dependent methyltransferase
MTQTQCRACGRRDLAAILSLGEQPPANALTEDPVPPAEARFPLELAICPDCSLVQLTVSVPPEDLFRDYPYFSSYSPALVSNAAALVDRVMRERHPAGDDLVMEIGSNDGYLLQHYQAKGVQVLGIDPAENIAELANKQGVPTICAFFSEELGSDLARRGRRATVVHANNVLAHVPDVNGVLSGLRHVLAEGGVAIVETPYVRDLVAQLEFDTIYHEHLYYYSVTALEKLCRRNGLRLDGVEHIPVHGGSLRAFIVEDDTRPPPDSVAGWLRDEEQAGIPTPEYYRDFGRQVDELRGQLAALLTALKQKGARLVGYGAAAKATVLLNAIGATPDTLAYVADKSPHKQGYHIPGVGIRIVDPAHLRLDQPDYVLILAWTFADEIMSELEAYRGAGGRFILPIPHPRIVGSDEAAGQVSLKSPAS